MQNRKRVFDSEVSEEQIERVRKEIIIFEKTENEYEVQNQTYGDQNQSCFRILGRMDSRRENEINHGGKKNEPAESPIPTHVEIVTNDE